ncbi:MAG: hypothetical protein AAB312_04275 [Pseudomonadota bacterium]
MSQDKRFSDEFLNAFVDNQLAAEEKSQAFVEIGQDEALNRQVCELRKLHDLVQLAYSEPPAAPARAVGLNSRQARLRFGVAASVLLTLGIVLGSQIRMPATTPSVTAVPAAEIQQVARIASPTKPIQPKAAALADVADRVASQQTATAIPAAETTAVPVPVIARDAIPDNTTTKVLIHLARDDADQLSQALDDIESTLKHYRETRQSAHVEVVVNGKGLELVRIDTSAFAGRIQRLQREYDNLTFAACQNTIDRLAREQGIVVRLLPGVITIDSGMAEIMRRQNQGWTYLQV